MHIHVQYSNGIGLSGWTDANGWCLQKTGLAPVFRSSDSGTLGDIDPLNKVPFKRAIGRVKKGPL